MRKILLLSLLLFIISCKSPKEKLKEQFEINGKSFLNKINNDGVKGIKLTKIDTITTRKEMMFASNVCILAAENLQPYVLELERQYSRSQKEFKMWETRDYSGYYYDKRSDDYNKYSNKKYEYTLITNKAEEIRKSAEKSKDKTILRYDISFDYTIKDTYGMVSSSKIILPFTPQGEVKNLQTIVPEIMKKYDAEFVLSYLPESIIQ